MKNTKNGSSYIKVPRALFDDPKYSELSAEGMLLYSFIRDRSSLSMRNGDFIDENGEVFVYYTIEEVRRLFNCSHDKATALMNGLKSCGLIEIKRQGLGKPNKIYPIEPGIRGGKIAVCSADHPYSGMRKEGKSGCDFLACNNNKKSNTYFSQSDSVSEQAPKRDKDGWRISPLLMEYLKKVQAESDSARDDAFPGGA